MVMQDRADQDSVEQMVEKTNNLSVSENLEPTFSVLKKKKKKQVQIDLLDDEKENAKEEDKEDYPVGVNETREDITYSDYTYEELLSRVFHKLRENSPELAGERRRTIIKPPEVLRRPKQTAFANFVETCKTMHRQLEHVMTYLLTELGTTGSLDEKQRLLVKGRFTSSHFEGIIRRYFNEYVICSSCKSPDTLIEKDKETRLFILKCEKCLSERRVAPIKAGFVARVGNRKAERNFGRHVE